MTAMFDAMTALSSKYNNTPKASRLYDKTRDGFVISGGGGVVVLEEYEMQNLEEQKFMPNLLQWSTSDGFDMVAPSGEGVVHTKLALKNARNKIDYINTHGTYASWRYNRINAVGVVTDYKPKISSKVLSWTS